MARYKLIDSNPRLLPVNLASQLIPGTFEHALNQLIDQELDLSAFDARYRNDSHGCGGVRPGGVAQGGAVRLFARAAQQSID